MSNPSLLRNVLRQAAAWRTNRLLYPGWIIAPRKTRDRLRVHTDNWVLSIPSAINECDDTLRLWILFELTWRLELCLLPLFTNVAEAVEQLIVRVDYDALRLAPRSSTFTIADNSNDVVVEQAELSAFWMHLSFGILRFHREERHSQDFERWHDRIAVNKTIGPDAHARLCYERALFGLAQMDDIAVESALRKWPKNTGDPIWQLREAALHAEIGSLLVAEHLAEGVLKGLRSRLSRAPNDISSLSREGWTMFLLKVLENQRKWSVTPSEVSRKDNSRERWDQLSLLQCNPWNELEAFEVILDQPVPVPNPRMTFKTGFHPGKISVTHHMGGGFYDKISPAYEFMRLVEDAGCPPLVGNINVCVNRLVAAAAWLTPHDPVRTQSLVFRLMNEKTTEEYLSRHRVAALPEDQIRSLYDIAKRALIESQKVPGTGHGPSIEPKTTRAQHRLATSIEVIARTSIRLSSEELSELWEIAVALYAAPVVAHSHSLAKPMENLFASLFLAMPYSQLQGKLRDLVTLPIPRVRGFAVWNEYSWPELTSSFRNRVAKLTSTQLGEEWADVARGLVALVRDPDIRIRDRALIRLSILHEYGCLTAELSQQLADAYWAQAGPDGLPLSNVFLNSMCLVFPEPEHGTSTKIFHEYCISAPLNAVESGMTSPDNLLIDWLRGTAPLGASEATNRRYVKWNISDLSYMMDQMSAWWHSSGKAQLDTQEASARSRFFGSPPVRERVSRVLDVIRFVVIPRITAESSVFVQIKHLLKEFNGQGLSTAAVAPALQTLDMECDAATELRSALASHNEYTYLSALRGLQYWLRHQTRTGRHEGEFELPPIPVDILRELGIIASNRRQPHLGLALDTVANVLEEAPDRLDTHFTQSIIFALEYLYAETEYRLSDSSDGRIPYDEVPRYRQTAAEIAKLLRDRQQVDADIVAKWIATAETDPLPEVRHIIADA